MAGQVHQKGDAGEILEDDAGDDERNFLGAGGVGLPLGEFADVGFGHFLAVAIAQDGFQHQADGDGQFGNRADAGFFKGGKGVIGGALAGPGVELLEGIKKVMCFVHKLGLSRRVVRRARENGVLEERSQKLKC